MKLGKHTSFDILIALMFLAFVISGLCIYKDYGISIDEPTERKSEIVSYRWMNRFLFDRGVFVDEGTEDLENYQDKYYGVAVQMPLVFIEDVYQLITHTPMTTRSIYLMRHLYTYGLYITALFFFYRLLLNLFGSKPLGAAGVLMVYSFGRFFAHSFYNIKDMVFVSMFTICLYFAEKVISSEYDKKWCLIFSIISAFTVSSRIVGALLPLIILLIPIIRYIIRRQKLPLASMGIICLAYPLWILITPAAWLDPIRYSINCAFTFSNYNILEGDKLFGGQWIPNETTPPDFYLRWMGMTIPLVYQLFIISGLIVFPVHVIKKTNHLPKKLFIGIAESILLLTLLYQIIKRPAIYNDWRHVFFLYPIMILFAVLGIKLIFDTLPTKIKVLTAAVLSLSIVYNFIMIARNHPYQYAAYNPIGQQMASGYEGDYWGVSYYQHLLWIAEHNKEVKSVTTHFPIRGYMKTNYLMLTEEQKNQVRIPNVDTDYRIVWLSAPMDYYWIDPETGKEPVIDGYEEVNPITSYGIKLSSLYQKVQ